MASGRSEIAAMARGPIEQFITDHLKTLCKILLQNCVFTVKRIAQKTNSVARAGADGLTTIISSDPKPFGQVKIN
jgi:hypothetical protein